MVAIFSWSAPNLVYSLDVSQCTLKDWIEELCDDGHKSCRCLVSMIASSSGCAVAEVTLPRDFIAPMQK